MAERVGVNGSGAFFVKKCDSPKANGDASQFGKKTHPEFFRVDSMLEKRKCCIFFQFPKPGKWVKRSTLACIYNYAAAPDQSGGRLGDKLIFANP